MAGDYIPSKDSDYAVWLLNFTTVLAAYEAELGLLPVEVTPLIEAKGAFCDALANHQTTQFVAAAATEAKNSRRTASEELLRPMVRRITNYPGMTDELRVALGLKVPSGGHSILSAGTEVPDLYLESGPGTVTVHYGTTPANERLNSKPSWSKGCNIYRKKNNETEYTLMNFETASPYVDYVTGPAADYTYIVQYRGTKAADVGRPSSPMTIASGGLLAA